MLNFVENNIENNEKSPKFEIGDHVRISKYKNIFAKGYVPNWSQKIFIITKILFCAHILFRGHVNNIFIRYLKAEEIIGMFNKKELRKTN